MQKSTIVVGLVLMCTLLAYLDYTVNNYGQFSETEEQTIDDNTSASEIFSQPETSVLSTHNNSASIIQQPLQKVPGESSSLIGMIKNKSNLNLQIKQADIADSIFRLIPLEAIPFVTEQTIMEIGLTGGTFFAYELKTEHKKANLSYQVLKDTAFTLKKPSYEVNVTDKYGNGSFFINSSTSPDTALLTVLINEQDGILAFEYSKSLHSFIEQILNLF